MITVPLLCWRAAPRRDWAGTWEGVVAGVADLDARGRDAGVGSSIARSAMLRAMEQPSLPRRARLARGPRPL